MHGEFALLDQLSRHLSPAGPTLPVGYGDDAAILDLQGRHAVVSVDALVEGTHWTSALSTPADVGWKAVSVGLSDLAAMGASPVAAVIALHLPPHVRSTEVDELYGGLAEAAATYGLALVGGDTVASAEYAISVTVMGAVEPGRGVLRSGARAGDALVCIGSLGRASAGLAAATATGPDGSDPLLLAAHRRPRPLLRAGGVLAEGGARAMIDVSDGLGADLGHICRASGVDAVVQAERLPICDRVRAVADRLHVDPIEFACGGEDLALIAAMPAEDAERTAALAGREEGAPAAVIGRVEAPSRDGGTVTLEGKGESEDLTGRGYEHLKGPQ